MIRKLKVAIYALLTGAFPDLMVYFDEAVDGLQKPCFFVNVKSECSIETAAVYHYTVEIEISCELDEPDEDEKIRIVETLAEIFNPILSVEDRRLLVQNFSLETFDNSARALQVTFNLDFRTGIPEPPPGEKMKDIQYKIAVNDGEQKIIVIGDDE